MVAYNALTSKTPQGLWRFLIIELCKESLTIPVCINVPDTFSSRHFLCSCRNQRKGRKGAGQLSAKHKERSTKPRTWAAPSLLSKIKKISAHHGSLPEWWWLIVYTLQCSYWEILLIGCNILHLASGLFIVLNSNYADLCQIPYTQDCKLLPYYNPKE